MSRVVPDVCEVETCESCGRQFSCGAKLPGCWCSDVSLPDAARADIAARFGSCLCRACLERFAARGRGAEDGANLSDAV